METIINFLNEAVFAFTNMGSTEIRIAMAIIALLLLFIMGRILGYKAVIATFIVLMISYALYDYNIVAAYKNWRTDRVEDERLLRQEMDLNGQY